MARLEYFLVAESCSLDQVTNHVSMFDIIEEVHSASFPVVIPRVAAVACLILDSSEMGQDFQGNLRVSGSAVEPTRDFPVNFTCTKLRQRLFVRLAGLPVLRPGEIEFEFLLNGGHQARHTLTVNLLDQANSDELVAVPPSE